MSEVMANCGECGKPFQTLSQYLKHFLEHKPLMCPNKCELSFDDPTSWMTHLRLSHISTHPHQCDSCLERFHSETDYSTHRANDCERESYCYKCERKFSHPSFMSRHVLLDHQEPPYQCLLCSGKFATKEDFIVHREYHVYQCPACDTFFALEQELDAHLHNFHKPDSGEKFEGLQMRPPEENYDDEVEEYTFEEYSQMVFMCFVCLARFKTCDRLDEHLQHHNVVLCENGCIKNSHSM